MLFAVDGGVFVGTALAAEGGTVETGLTIASPRLGHDFTYAVYLPPGAAKSNIPLPVLYLLHGRDDTEAAWLDNGRIADTLDRLIESGAIGPLAVVMPMAGNSWYVDDARGAGGFGPFATAFAKDFIPAVERRHHFATCRGARAIGGLSMGGYGAILYALTNPEMFDAAISLSGSLFSDDPVQIQTRKPFYDRVMDGIFGTPFDPERFRSWTVFSRLNASPPSVQSLGVWLTAGDGDFAGIINGTVRLHQELRRRKIESHMRIYDGEHTWALWSMAITPALQWLSTRLKPTCNAK